MKAFVGPGDIVDGEDGMTYEADCEAPGCGKHIRVVWPKGFSLPYVFFCYHCGSGYDLGKRMRCENDAEFTLDEVMGGQHKKA